MIRTLFSTDMDEVWMDDDGVHWEWENGDASGEKHFSTPEEAADYCDGAGREDIAEAIREIMNE